MSKGAALPGVPYDFFIRHAMEAALRRGVRRPPRPNQLYHEKNCEYVLKQWCEWIDTTFRPSALLQYRVEAFCGLQAQIDHQNWVVDRLKARGSNYLVGEACFIKKVLPNERAITEFGEERVAQARDDVRGSDAADLPSPTADDLRPSCFGVPHAHEPASETCAI